MLWREGCRSKQTLKGFLKYDTCQQTFRRNRTLPDTDVVLLHVLKNKLCIGTNSIKSAILGGSLSSVYVCVCVYVCVYVCVCPCVCVCVCVW